jgi:hypothetical protein
MRSFSSIAKAARRVPDCEHGCEILFRHGEDSA